jgi:hypothetical protein
MNERFYFPLLVLPPRDLQKKLNVTYDAVEFVTNEGRGKPLATRHILQLGGSVLSQPLQRVGWLSLIYCIQGKHTAFRAQDTFDNIYCLARNLNYISKSVIACN